MTTLTKAHNEWAKRADDERFSSLADLHTSAMQRYQHGANVELLTNTLKAVPSVDGSRLLLSSDKTAPAPMSAWSFSQLARMAGAPPSYLPDLPVDLAAQCINHGLGARDDGDKDKSAIYFHNVFGEAPRVRAINTDRYSRIHDADITSRLLRLEAEGVWQPAPAAFDGSRGLYAGDRDMFAFMVDNNRRIFETLPGGGLSRGFFVWNSEVGARSFGLMTFLYEYVCGNHRVWGASNVKEVSFRHVGDVNDRAFKSLTLELTEYANGSATEDEARIERMRTLEVGGTKDEILDRLFSLRQPVLTKRLIRQAIDLTEQREDWYGNPRSVWAIGGALTEIARDLPHADSRLALDVAATKVYALAT